jgi:bifunctional DNA-binding transcriptional regulator/antitoxin component of YhaV-PrlF toxin-antitoxin module
MQEKYEIKQIHHNRCVVIPAEHLALAGIDKGGYVTVKVEGGEIRLQKVNLCQRPSGPEAGCCKNF